MSRRNALMASRSDRPSSACNTITVATTSAGTDGCPPPWRTTSANSSGGNNWRRWSARNAYTDPWGIRWRHQVAASNWASEGWLAGLIPVSLPATNRQRELPDRRGQQNRPKHAAFSRLLVLQPEIVTWLVREGPS